jgi:ActR/RegA family two-component response regulator
MTSVLILDDDVVVSGSLRRLFTEDGFDVTVSNHFSEAEEHLKRRYFDVVVCDWDLGVAGLGKPGDELHKLSEMREPGGRYDYHLVCFSGLDRPVPEGVEMFRKDHVLELLDYIHEIVV